MIPILSYIVLLLIAALTIAQSITSCTDQNQVTPKKKHSQKISSSLLNIIEHLESQPTEKGQLAPSIKAARIDEEGKIEVYINLYEIDETKLDTLKKYGLKIDIYDNTGKLVQGRALPNNIENISKLSFVKFIDLPTYGVTN